MFTPNSPKEENEQLLPEWHEPFPQPNTIPLGWDYTAMSAAPVNVSISDPKPEVDE
jgi:hypothetical protein